MSAETSRQEGGFPQPLCGMVELVPHLKVEMPIRKVPSVSPLFPVDSDALCETGT